MKKFVIFLLTLVLTAAIFTGCGCTGPEVTTPTTLPATTTTATTAPTMPSTTQSTTEATTQSTIDRGNGPAEETTTTPTGTEETAESRTRRMDPMTR